MIREPKITLTQVLFAVGIIALIIAIILPSIQRLRMTGGSTPCASNMRHIGEGLLLYSMEHGGRYPLRLDELHGRDWSLPPEIFSCAVSGKPVVFVAPIAVVSDLTGDDVVAHEPLSAHGGEGSTVLYGDGHVCWLTAVELEHELGLSTTRATTRRAQ